LTTSYWGPSRSDSRFGPGAPQGASFTRRKRKSSTNYELEFEGSRTSTIPERLRGWRGCFSLGSRFVGLNRLVEFRWSRCVHPGDLALANPQIVFVPESYYRTRPLVLVPSSSPRTRLPSTLLLLRLNLPAGVSPSGVSARSMRRWLFLARKIAS
jgi:hypothetical protein